MIRIDGAAGGGQLLRSALGFAAVTDEAFRIDDIRADRPTPGLRPQHLAAVELLADCCDATVSGATVGSSSLTFRPGAERRRTLSADIGTAGSVALLFDAVLPVAAADGRPFRVDASGGTDVKWAPTVAYLRRVKLPLLRTFGIEATVDRHRTGFYPAGGGRATFRSRSAALSPLNLPERGDLRRVDVYSTAAEALSGADVARRQADRTVDRLSGSGVPVGERSVEYVPADSPGSSLLVRAVYEHSRAGFVALGERGRPSEAVADDAVDAFEVFRKGGAAVDEYMADQLMAPLALAGGRVSVPRVTDHVRTNCEVLRAFGSDVRVVADGSGPDGPTIRASAHPALDGAGASSRE